MCTEEVARLRERDSRYFAASHCLAAGASAVANDNHTRAQASKRQAELQESAVRGCGTEIRYFCCLW